MEIKNFIDPCNPVRCNNLHTLDCKDNMIYCQDADEVLAMIGISDSIIIRLGRRTIIAHKSRMDDVKKMIDMFTKEV
jgi:mannose-1-phosphate guanylyltransferase